LLRRIKITFILLCIGVVGYSLPDYQGDSVPDDFCISENEYELHILINEYRSKFNQSSIPLSKSLSWVARLHAQDLFHYEPNMNPCTDYSWSNQGRWSPCCYQIKDPDYSCMHNKPSEITNYTGKGYELVYWGNTDIKPKQPFEMWTAYHTTRSMIIGADKWEDFDWKAIGIAIYEGYAIVWFGTEVDETGVPLICSEIDEIGAILVISDTAATPAVSDTINESQVSDDPQKHYLIAASFNTLESANNALVEYKTNGFVHAKVLITGPNYRICLDEFRSIDEAQRIKGNIAEMYPDAWILSQ